MTALAKKKDVIATAAAAPKTATILPLAKRPAAKFDAAKIAASLGRNVLPPLVVLAILLAVWQMLCSSPTASLPSPLQVWQESYDLIAFPFFDYGSQDIGLGWRVIVSLQRGLAGYIVPSKLYGILAAGRAFVAAVEESCEVASIAATHQCGLIAEPGDARQLAARIREFHDDRDLVRRYGANARAVAVSFDRRLQVARYMDVFRRVRPARDLRDARSIEGEVVR